MADTLDLILAIAHHILAFSLFGLLAMEIAIIKPGLSAAGLPRVGRIDGLYGALAAALIVIGICRVFYGLKDWEFYVYNPVFWAKMAAFIAVGLLSIPPTVRILAWRREARAGRDAVPVDEIRSLRFYLMAEATVFLLILVFAAMMARGYGY